MTELVLDTNFLVANFDTGDKWHNLVKSMKSEILAKDVTLINLDCVISETISVIARRFEEKKKLSEFPATLETIHNVVSPSKITWISHYIEDWYLQIIDVIRQYQGKINFNDALIALYMRKDGIKYFMSFDTDFDDIPWIERIKTKEDVKNI